MIRSCDFGVIINTGTENFLLLFNEIVVKSLLGMIF